MSNNSEDVSLENQIFSWEGWDIQDTMCFSFYDVSLNVPIGKYPAGTKFDLADADYERSVVEFSNYGEPDENGHRMANPVFKAQLRVSVQVLEE